MATVPIRPLAWEPPYATGVAQEMANRQKKNTEDNNQPKSFWSDIHIPRMGKKDGLNIKKNYLKK